MSKPDEETLQLLIGCGRETAGHLLASAVETATDAKIAQNQLFVAYRAALNMIATFAYNDQKQLGKSFEQFKEQFIADLEHELAFLNASDEMELVKHKVQT